MFVIRILLPLLYSFLVGSSYSLVTKRKFIDSLAPAFFIQIILMLLSGITMERLTYGIILMVVVSIGIIAYASIKNKTLAVLSGVYKDEKGHIELGVLLFVFVYFFIFAANVGKHYNMWDEFSHLGWFVRESYNNDFLYCISPKYFEHKDYVPGVTLFETLWCRLSLKYSEPNAYRGIQMLQTSMMLPLVTHSWHKLSMERHNKLFQIGLVIVNGGIVFAIPLLFRIPFYHTIYTDLILGIFIFYCVWIIFTEKFGGYSLAMLGLILCCIGLCSWNAGYFLPVLFLLYAIYHHFFADKSVSRAKIWTGSITFTIMSLLPTQMFYYYLAQKGVYRVNGSLIDTLKYIGRSSNNAVVTKEYFDAFFLEGIIGKLSIFWLIIICAVCLVLFGLVLDKMDDKRKIGLLVLWIITAGLYYIFIMYLSLYNMDSKDEAIFIDHFSKYMSTYALAVFLIIMMAYILYSSSKYRFISYFTAIMLIENIALFFGAYQVLPGILTHDEVWYEGHIDYLNKSVPSGSDLLIIIASADNNAPGRIGYYCENINLNGGAFGTKIEDDLWTQDLSIEEFVDKCSSYDYLYFFSYDDEFPKLYADAFESEGVIDLGKLYKVEIVNGKIRTIAP